MNKYLFKKIEQANSAYFENLIFMANEVCRGRISEAFEEFTELDPIEITKVLGWNDKETTLELIKESVQFAFNNSYDTLPEFVQCHSQEMSEQVMRQHINLYVNDFTINMGAAGKEAIAQLENVWNTINPIT